MEPIRYFDRASGRVEEERVYGGRALEVLYRRWWMRPLTDTLLVRSLPNRVYGLFKRRPGSKRDIERFVSSLGIDASEAEKPLPAYASLDDFFSRRLRPDARPVDPDPAHLVSPADARVLVFPRLACDHSRAAHRTLLPVKGQRVPVGELLGDEAWAERLSGGAAVVLRLAPADYHRFHFPDSADAGAPRRIHGKLHSVHPIALGAGAPSFQNARDVCRLRTDHFGTVAMVEVGALLVGTIVQTYAPGPVARGAEKGLFRMGGSTVVLLFEPQRVRFDDDLSHHSARGLETRVKMGTRLGVTP